MAPIVVPVPLPVCLTPWQTSVQEFVARLYEMGRVPFGPTTFTSKFTILSPLTAPLEAPIPCAVWHVEQLKPALM